jgi:polysaccharide pyruvyl transferase WcaK-like protein
MTAPANALASARPLHVGLLWHTFKSENLGVGALTLANINLIAAAVEAAGRQPVFHLMGSRGQVDYSQETAYPNDFVNVGYKALAKPWSDLHRTMARCDIVFDIGSGDSFSDIYAWGRYGMMLLSKVMVAGRGTPLVLSPQTIGPFTDGKARLAAQGALKFARHVFARDETSFRLLGEMGLGRKSSLTTDVAFALPYDRPADKDGRDLTVGRKIKVGLNVSALMYRRDAAAVASDKIRLTVDYPALIDSLLDRLTGDPRFEVHFVPHVLASFLPHEDDYAASEALRERYPQVILPPRFAGPSQAKTYIADLDLLMGSRMHATIAAISSDTAVVPLGYSRKFNGLFDSIGYGWNVDMTSTTNEAALATVDAALADLPKVRSDAIAANAEARRRLENYRAFLGQTIAQVAARA